jgi:pimeloyl-ACP methyl ester carboxylesterase
LGNIGNEFRLNVKQDLEQMQTAKWVEKSNIPGLIIHDRKDRETSFEHAVNLEKSWKGSKLIPTEGLGHNLRSEEIIDLLTHFITKGKIIPSHKGSVPIAS